MLTQPHRQETLSVAYIHAVAACAGMSCGSGKYDYGIDLCVTSIIESGGRYRDSGFRLDIQAKSTTASSLTATHVVYDLDANVYDLLRDPNAGCPRVLVLMVLPADESDWLAVSEQESLVRRCAYWMSFWGMPASPNTTSIRVRIPRANLLTPASLQAILDRISKKEPLP